MLLEIALFSLFFLVLHFLYVGANGDSRFGDGRVDSSHRSRSHLKRSGRECHVHEATADCEYNSSEIMPTAHIHMRGLKIAWYYFVSRCAPNIDWGRFNALWKSRTRCTRCEETGKTNVTHLSTATRVSVVVQLGKRKLESPVSKARKNLSSRRVRYPRRARVAVLIIPQHLQARGRPFRGAPHSEWNHLRVYLATYVRNARLRVWDTSTACAPRLSRCSRIITWILFDYGI